MLNKLFNYLQMLHHSSLSSLEDYWRLSASVLFAWPYFRGNLRFFLIFIFRFFSCFGRNAFWLYCWCCCYLVLIQYLLIFFRKFWFCQEFNDSFFLYICFFLIEGFVRPSVCLFGYLYVYYTKIYRELYICTYIHVYYCTKCTFIVFS